MLHAGICRYDRGYKFLLKRSKGWTVILDIFKSSIEFLELPVFKGLHASAMNFYFKFIRHYPGLNSRMGAETQKPCIFFNAELAPTSSTKLGAFKENK